MPSPPRRPAVTLTFDLHNLPRSTVGTSEYSLSVLSKLFKAFVRYRGNNISPNKRTNVAGGQAENIMSLPTLSDDESIKAGSSSSASKFYGAFNSIMYILEEK